MLCIEIFTRLAYKGQNRTLKRLHARTIEAHSSSVRPLVIGYDVLYYLVVASSKVVYVSM
jgi:hypothetical protein